MISEGEMYWAYTPFSKNIYKYLLFCCYRIYRRFFLKNYYKTIELFINNKKHLIYSCSCHGNTGNKMCPAMIEALYDKKTSNIKQKTF